MKQKQATIKKGNLRILLSNRKSEYPGYSRVEITFPDIYQCELQEAYGWNEAAISSMDMQIFGRLKDLEAIINWEDREFFTVDIPNQKSNEPVSQVYQALEILLAEKPYTAAEIESMEDAAQSAGGKADQLRAQELPSVREETTLFSGYKKVPTSRDAPLGHKGYCVIKMVNIKKTKGLTYDDESFIGAEHRKTVTKPNMVLLDVSVSGDPFLQYYGRNIDYKLPYNSLIREDIEKLSDNKDRDMIKSKPKISTTTGDSERIKFLCTKEFALKVGEYFKGKFRELE